MEILGEKLVGVLMASEPLIKKAGALALKLRNGVTAHKKLETGIHGIDIVTDADFKVQEKILQEMAKTELVNCQLFAEEDTPSVSKFKGTNGFILSLDPIDGTAIYASSGRFFCTIIYLRKGSELLYSFYNYPVLNWARRITRRGIEDFGKTPEAKVRKDLDLSKTIAYTFRGPESMDKAIYNELIDRGYSFRNLASITDDSGSCTLFFLNQVAGYLTASPNPHDGLGAMHYGQQKGYKIYSTLDFSKLEPSDHGPHFKGWYLVLRK